MQPQLPVFAVPTPSSNNIDSSSQSLLLYTVPIGGQVFAVRADGTVLLARRVPPEFDGLPLWLLSVQKRAGSPSSFPSIKGFQHYFDTEEMLAFASSHSMTEWHHGTPPPGVPKTTKPLKEEPSETPFSEETSSPIEENIDGKTVTELPVSPLQQPLSPLEQERQQREKVVQAQIDKLATARATDIQKISAALLSLDNNYCQEALQQGQKSFQFAVKFAPWGIGFIAFSTVLLLVLTFFFGQGHLDAGAAIVNASGSLLIEGLPGVGFFLYYQASRQFKEFSRRIDLRHRYLLANSIIVTSLEGQEKQQAVVSVVTSILKGEEPEILSGNDASK